MNTLPSFEASVAVQKKIEALNQAYFDLILTIARTKDPVAAALIGLKPETIEEYASVRSFDLVNAGKIGIPLCIARFTEPSEVRQIFKAGISTPKILAAVTKSLPHDPFFKRLNGTGGVKHETD